MIRLDETKRGEAIEAGWKAYQERFPTTERSMWAFCYIKAIKDWQPIAVCDDDKVIGALLVKDGKIHLGIIPEYRGRWASRRIIKEMLTYGKRTELLESESPKFIERIGFRKTEAGYEFH